MKNQLHYTVESAYGVAPGGLPVTLLDPFAPRAPTPMEFALAVAARRFDAAIEDLARKRWA